LAGISKPNLTATELSYNTKKLNDNYKKIYTKLKLITKLKRGLDAFYAT